MSSIYLNTYDNHLIPRWTGCKRGRSRFTGQSVSDEVGFCPTFGIPNARFGTVSASTVSYGPYADTKPIGIGGFGSTEKLSQSTHVLRHVRLRADDPGTVSHAH